MNSSRWSLCIVMVIIGQMVSAGDACCHNRVIIRSNESILCKSISSAEDCIDSDLHCYWNCGKNSNHLFDGSYEVKLIGKITDFATTINAVNISAPQEFPFENETKAVAVFKSIDKHGILYEFRQDVSTKNYTNVKRKFTVSDESRRRLISDTRVVVANLNGNRAFLKAIAYIYKSGTGHCSGALISATYLLTAAHCVFDRSTGKPYDIKKDWIYFNRVTAPGLFSLRGYYNVKRCSWFDRYEGAQEGIHRLHDFAICELETAVNGITPFVFSAITWGAKIPSFTTAGFPGDGEFKDKMVISELTINGRHNLHNKGIGTYYFDNVASEGQSGSPIFDTEGHVVYAIQVSAGDDGMMGLLITEPRLVLMCNWMRNALEVCKDSQESKQKDAHQEEYDILNENTAVLYDNEYLFIFGTFVVGTIAVALFLCVCVVFIGFVVGYNMAKK